MKSGHSLKLLHVDGLENYRMTGHFYIERNEFPVIICHSALSNRKCSPLIQPAQQSPAKGHIFKQGTIQPGHAKRSTVNPYHSAHGTEDLQFPRWSVVMRIRK